MPSVRCPWITWTDGILSVLIVTSLIAESWLQYRDGLYCKMDGMVVGFCMLVAVPVMGLAILFRPWLNGEELAQWHQFWIRPALLAGIALSVFWLWSLNLFNLPGASSFTTGCLASITDQITEADIHALRVLVKNKRSSGDLKDGEAIKREELPSAFLKLSWRVSKHSSISFHRSGIKTEIDVYCGSGFIGAFGLEIDPEIIPEEGLTQIDDGPGTWRKKLFEGVYFYHAMD